MIHQIKPEVKEWYILLQGGAQVVIKAAHCWEDENTYWFSDGGANEDPYARIQKAWTMVVTDNDSSRTFFMVDEPDGVHDED